MTTQVLARDGQPRDLTVYHVGGRLQEQHRARLEWPLT